MERSCTAQQWSALKTKLVLEKMKLLKSGQKVDQGVTSQLSSVSAKMPSSRALNKPL